MRWLGRILQWGLLTVLALLVLAVLAAEMLSWNFLKAPVEERFEAATGRSLSIDGDLSLSLFPYPVVSFDKVTLDNPDWAEAPNMAEMERVRAWPSLRAALSGQLVLDRVTIEAPEVDLEARTGGANNWAFSAPDEPAPDDQEQGGAQRLIVRQLSVSNARIRYRAPDQQPLAFSIPSLHIDDDGESTALQASISFREKAFDVEAHADSIRKLARDGGGFDGELSVRSDQGRMRATFVLAEAPSLQPAHVDWELELQNVADWSRWAGQPVIDLQTLSLGSQLDYNTGRWGFTNIEIGLAGSLLTGEVEIDTGGLTPVLIANLHSPEFDAAAFFSALPDNGEPIDSVAAAVPVLPDLSASVGLSIENLLWGRHHIRDLTAELDMADRVLAVERLAFVAADGSVTANAELASDSKTLALNLHAHITGLDLALLEVQQDLAGIITGELAFDLDRVRRQPSPGIQEMFEQLRIEQASASYTNEARHIDVRATLETTGVPTVPRISVTGDVRNQLIEAMLSGDPLTGPVTAPADYGLEASARSGNAKVHLKTDLASMLQPKTLAGTFELTADNIRDLQPWLQRTLPSVPGLHAAGRIERDGGHWYATDLEVEAGRSNVTGDVHFRNTERPFVDARLHAARMDPMQWIVDSGASDEHANQSNRDSDTDTGVEGDDALLAVLRSVDGRLDLRVDRLDLPADFDLHELVASATLEEGRAEIDRLQFGIAEGQVAATLNLDASEQRAFGRLDAEFDGLVLGRLVDTPAPLANRLGKMSGVVRLAITETHTEKLSNDLMFPRIGRVRFQESRLRFENPESNTDLTLTMQTRGLDEGSQEFHVDGQGQYDGDPFALEFRGDGLLHARDPERPYALKLDGEIVDTRFGLSGTVLSPLTLKGMDLELSLAGPNPQRIERILGIPFPMLSAYTVSGDLSLKEGRWVLQNLDGQVGSSDLSGRVGIDFGVRPPHLSARLQSESVRMADLAGVFGARPGEAAPADRFVLPQRPLIEDAWRKVTADVRYRGHSLQAGNVPLSNVVINFLLEDGRMQFAPVAFGVGDGSIDFNLDLNVRERPRHGTLEATMHGVDLQEALRHWEPAGDSLGVIGGRGKFWVEGASIAELLASADGGLLLLMQGGRLDAVLVEIAGLDALQVVTSFLGNRDPIPIDCAYIDVMTRDGLATLDTFVIDSKDTKFTAGGEIDFTNERLDITMVANPKDVSVGVVRSPLQMSGTFNNVGMGVSTGAIATRLGAAAVLGALATPVAALIPLLDMGTGQDSGYCEGLTHRTHEAIKGREEQN